MKAKLGFARTRKTALSDSKSDSNDSKDCPCYRSAIRRWKHIFSDIWVEINSLHIRNDDELSISSLLGAITFFLVFFIVLMRKMYLYGSTLVEKIILVLTILLLIFSVFSLILYFS